ncbi:MAG: hypothetical protein VXY53_07065, partial [Candidatus Thermoplasmatota archaeon]|nr:hypothetical protein [Candidatus Thermoplasmatota archaeon]
KNFIVKFLVGIILFGFGLIYFTSLYSYSANDPGFNQLNYNINESDIENLNSPSALFKSYSDVGHLYGENAHGWHALVAELSMLAMGKEFSDYKQ